MVMFILLYILCEVPLNYKDLGAIGNGNRNCNFTYLGGNS